MERLQKIIAQAGLASRRAAEKMILAGEVYVDGKQVTELGTQADPWVNKIFVQGKELKLSEPKVYYLLNKPSGYLSAVKDDRGRKTILCLFPDVKARIYPVGRLDYKTEGLLLVTNDGALTNRLLHPASLIEKTYLAQIRGVIDEESLKKLRSGIMLSDGLTAEAKAELINFDYHLNTSKVKLTIHEGRNRQVRRMFDSLGYQVLKLKRVEFAGLNLSGVKAGQYRPLTAIEVKFLFSL